MAQDDRPLIVGAGPTGLAAALFLSHRGITARLVDAAPEPARHSKALGVNPRTLDLLEPTGVTAAIVAEGRAMRGATFWEGWTRTLGAVDIDRVHPRYRLTALSQARTETLLAEALAARGTRPERGVALSGLEQTEGRLGATLTHPDGRQEMVAPPLLFAADGARSASRHALGLGFEGSTLPEPWPLHDVRLDTPLALDRAHIALFDDGLVFMLALEPGLWRVLGNVEDPLSRLPHGTAVGEVVWSSRFKISHRVASAAAVGRVALGGDAAHVHSPMGARGMNLGIEDAYVFAAVAEDALAGRRALSDYDRLRRPVHRAVVRRIELITRFARGRPAILRTIRRLLLPALTGFAPTAHLMTGALTGLDHEARTA